MRGLKLQESKFILDGNSRARVESACFHVMEPLSWALVRVVVVAERFSALSRQNNAGHSPAVILPKAGDGIPVVLVD
jgi:hypothetical protein